MTAHSDLSCAFGKLLAADVPVVDRALQIPAQIIDGVCIQIRAGRELTSFEESNKSIQMPNRMNIDT